MKIALVTPKNEFSEDLFDHLKRQFSGDDLMFWQSGQPAPAGDVELIIGIGPITRETLQNQPKLTFIQTASDGFDAVDINAATELGIWVGYCPGAPSGNADAVAEYAVMLLIAANRRLHEALAFIYDHNKPRPLSTPSLVGKTVCIYGFGDIGERVAARLKPFGGKLIAVDSKPKHVGEGVQAFSVDGQKEALGQADAVVLCVRGSAENRHLVNADFLAKMKQGATLVNIARGSLVDEAALADALRSGHLGAAGLDVQEHEPVDPSNPLLQIPTAFLTPHIAGFTDTMLEGTLQYLKRAVEAYRDGKRLKSVLNDPKQPRRPLQPASE